jgi:putative ABC transport system permease protein
MLRNYLISVIRYVSRNKAFTFINVLGLLMGMLSCMLILQYVSHELSYDDFHERKDRIFRVQLDRYDKGELATRWASGAAGIGPDFKTHLPEVTRYVRMTHHEGVFAYGDNYFKEEGTWFASEDFFRMFTIRLIYGSDSLVLKEPFKMVLSQTMARKYFGDQNPVGKLMRANGRTDYEITGVFEDLPANTHMKIDALMSFESLKKLWNNEITSWNWDGFMTYIELAPRADPAFVESKLPALAESINGEELKRWNAGMVFHLQPLNDIHLDSDFIGEFKENGNRQSAYFLTVVAVLILIIAWINYINLATAKSVERAREVGVRKVMGSVRSQLIQQFIFESFLLNLLAVLVSILLVIVLTPYFGSLTGRTLDYRLFSTPLFWASALAIVVCGSLLSGLYPAFVLSGFKPVDVLKGRFKNSGDGLLLRKGMVITQFVASITLLGATFTVYQQIGYMRSQELGINVNQTVIIQSPRVVDSTYQNRFQVLKNALTQFPEVSSLSASTAVPGTSPDWNAGGIRTVSQREDEAKQYRVIMMDHDYIPAYGLDVVAGRSFSGDQSHEERSLMLNEAASRIMGFDHAEQALNNNVVFWGDTFRIVGVVKNFHNESLKKAFEPLLFRYNSSPGGYYSVKFNTANVQSSMAKFEEQWKTIFPGNPFIYFFLDDHYDKQYRQDQQFGKVFGVFSTLAILIACLGLFGLSSLTAVQRTKEIGVRKVLGASVPQILTMISREYLILCLLAIAVAVPCTIWIADQWLQRFAYRIDIGWWMLAAPCLAVTAIALLTVVFTALRAATANPVSSLRHE